MSRFETFRILGVMLLAWMPVGCFQADATSGGSGDEGAAGTAGSPAGSGVPPSTSAQEATADQAEQVCEAVNSMQSVMHECTRYAAESTDSSEACIAMRDSCLGWIEAEPDDMDDACDGEEIRRGLSTCDGVTVGEIETCLVQRIEAETELTCDAPRGAELPPPACFMELVQKCPDLFDEGGGEDGSGPGGDGDGDGLTCAEEGLDPSGVDCEAFCTPLAASDCDGGPSMEGCLQVCREARTVCPTALVRLAGCAQAQGGGWTCSDQGDPVVAGGCMTELQCFGGCIDVIME